METCEDSSEKLPVETNVKRLELKKDIPLMY